MIRSGHSRSHIYDPRKILTTGLPADEEENKLKQKLQAKLKNRKGFTLIEMLIVVAIIAILVAVSIPLVTTSLEKARVATDQANERAAKAAYTVDYLMNDTEYEVGDTVYFDAENGTVINDSWADVKGKITPYGQCSEHKNGILCFQIQDGDPGYRLIWIDQDGTEMKIDGGDSLHSIDG